MKKLDLNEAAEEFEMISSDMHLFYYIETGELLFIAILWTLMMLTLKNLRTALGLPRRVRMILTNTAL